MRCFDMVRQDTRCCGYVNSQSNKVDTKYDFLDQKFLDPPRANPCARFWRASGTGAVVLCFERTKGTSHQGTQRLEPCASVASASAL